MKLILNKREKIVLAKYWLYRIEDIWGDELNNSSDYKEYYLPLKSYLIDQGKYVADPSLHQKIALQFAIPQKYYDIDYKKLRDSKYPSLFKVMSVTHLPKNGKKEDAGVYKSSHHYSKEKEKRYNQSDSHTVKTFKDIQKPKAFADSYIRAKDFVDNDRFNNKANSHSNIDYSADSKALLEDMNNFLIAITPTPMSDRIETLLGQINREKLNLVNTKEKQEESGNNKANDISERPQRQKKTDIREKNHGQEGKHPSIDFKKLLPQYIKWKQIEINILDEDSIKIEYPGGSFDVRFSQTQYFVNKTTSRCNNLWGLLLELAQIGSFQPNSSTYKILTKKPGKAKHRVYALGKALMNEFGIIEKPFLLYNSQDGWFPKFTIRDRRKNIYRASTQAEIYKAQESSKRKRQDSSIPIIGDSFSSEDLDSFADEQKDYKDKLDHRDKGFHTITEDEL